MPAPKPQPDESRSDYMERCVPFFVKEGRADKQAVAICESMYDQHKDAKASVEKTLGQIRGH